jgi:SAM-dependent methyltransferase
MQYYNDKFYKFRQEASISSAREVIPIILDLIKPKSVIDVGCGVGTWLTVFRELGIEDFMGVDGDWVDRNMLMIPPENFLSFDLSGPLKLKTQFDLVVSLEVAEHLPEECARDFVESLTALGDVVLFSAAIPFQIGKHHINLQWQTYWTEIFKEKDYLAIDAIRKRIWQNDKVEYWYAQNILIFAKRDYIETHPDLKKEYDNTCVSLLSIVHPKMLQLNSTPIRIILAIPFINELFLALVTSHAIRSYLRRVLLK